MDDTISRRTAMKQMEMLFRDLEKETCYANGVWYNHGVADGIVTIKNLTSAEPNRIARETAGKSPDEIYDFLHWLMLEYGKQFTDSRAAVIEWLKEDQNG